VYLKSISFSKKIKGISGILRPGDCSLLSYFEPGDIVHAMEMYPGKGAVFSRAAGTFCQIRALTNNLINNNQINFFLYLEKKLIYDINFRREFYISTP